LEHVETTPFAAMFRSGTGALRVTLVERVQAAGYTVLGWLVTDIDAAVAQLADRGVALLRYEGMAQDARGVWSAPGGAKVAWFHDPDGNVLSLTQTAMDHSTHR
jgi:catechol 2,3-dioxygenase-like lactoylglutathione lyase family enzyme